VNAPQVHERHTPNDKPEPVQQAVTPRRQAYTTPQLRLLGNLAELTQGGGSGDPDVITGSLDS
jgi:hypothetical protein